MKKTILTCRLVLWVAVPPPGDGPSFPPGPPTPNIDGLDPKPPDGLLDWTLEGDRKGEVKTNPTTSAMASQWHWPSILSIYERTL